MNTHGIRRSGRLVLLAASLAWVGCAAIPIGVKRVDPEAIHRNLTTNVLTVGGPSIPTRNLLFRRNLTQAFEREPEEALRKLHEWAVATSDDDAFYALAELSFLQGQRSGEHSWHLAAVLYSWAFLFGGKAPEPFDPRLRIAADLYNRGLTEALTPKGQADVELRGGEFSLPFGDVAVEFDERSLDWNGRRLTRFIPVAEIEIEGLSARFRDAGIGAPLAADAWAADPERSKDLLVPRLKVPVTALLRADDVRQQLASGHVRATLELYADPESPSLEIAGRRVPLEREHTATIAAMLADAPIWETELETFLGGKGIDNGRLVSLRPHRRGKIPVVFVHGTVSNPGRWAEMVNALDNDPELRARYEPWFFFYNSGSPILYSSYLLRESLAGAVAALDPDGGDSCLRDMVVIGHSQGGLLTKMTVVDSGDVFWSSVSRKRLEELQLTDADREIVRRVAFVTPLPFVKRVVFIATPHRGSFLAERTLVRRLVARLISLPRRFTDVTESLAAGNPEAFARDTFGQMTALDNMAPDHRFIRNLNQLPVVSGVASHSIIAVQGSGPLEGGDDGVVRYASAHVDGVESEVVVRSGHSTQSNPETIEEVRRILAEHAAVGSCGGHAEPAADVR